MTGVDNCSNAVLFCSGGCMYNVPVAVMWCHWRNKNVFFYFHSPEIVLFSVCCFWISVCLFSLLALISLRNTYSINNWMCNVTSHQPISYLFDPMWLCMHQRIQWIRKLSLCGSSWWRWWMLQQFIIQHNNPDNAAFHAVSFFSLIFGIPTVNPFSFFSFLSPLPLSFCQRDVNQPGLLLISFFSSVFQRISCNIIVSPTNVELPTLTAQSSETT